MPARKVISLLDKARSQPDDLLKFANTEIVVPDPLEIPLRNRSFDLSVLPPKFTFLRGFDYESPVVNSRIKTEAETTQARTGISVQQSVEISEPQEHPWPEELQRIFDKLNVVPPVLLMGPYAFDCYDKNKLVSNSKAGALPGAVLINTRVSDIRQKWVMVHEFGHALEARCIPANWRDLINRTDRNRMLRQLRWDYHSIQPYAGSLFAYNLKPNECWAYAVTQMLAKDEPWLMELIAGNSSEARANRKDVGTHKFMPYLPHWDPQDFQKLEPVMECALQQASLEPTMPIMEII